LLFPAIPIDGFTPEWRNSGHPLGCSRKIDTFLSTGLGFGFSAFGLLLSDVFFFVSIASCSFDLNEAAIPVPSRKIKTFTIRDKTITLDKTAPCCLYGAPATQSHENGTEAGLQKIKHDRI
jgi:hypothetical protein